MSRPKIPRNVLVVAFVAFFSGFGQDLITPVLPGYLALLGVGAAGIGLVDGILQGVTNVFRLVSGILSDRFRRRKGLVFIGYALSSVARPLLGAASAFLPVAALRAVDGAGKGIKDAPRDALVADAAAAAIRGRAFGFQRLVDTAGSVFGPLAATAILLSMTPSLAAYRTIFLAAALPGAAALALIAFGIRETEKPAAAKGAARAKLPLRFWLLVIGMTVAMLTKVNDSLFLLRAGDIGVPKTLIPAVFAGFTLIYALLSYPIGVWSDRFGKLPFIIAGWFVMAAVEFGFSIDPTRAGALLLFAAYGLFYALTEGSARAMIADVAPAESRGTAYAIYSTSVGLAVIAGGYGLGRVWSSSSPESAFHLAAIGSLIGALVLLALRSNPSKLPAAGDRGRPS